MAFYCLAIIVIIIPFLEIQCNLTSSYLFIDKWWQFLKVSQITWISLVKTDNSKYKLQWIFSYRNINTIWLRRKIKSVGFQDASVTCNNKRQLWSLSLTHFYLPSPNRVLLMEKKMATHSSVLAWEITWTEGAWWTTVHGVSKESDMTVTIEHWTDGRHWVRTCRMNDFLRSSMLDSTFKDSTPDFFLSHLGSL